MLVTKPKVGAVIHVSPSPQNVLSPAVRRPVHGVNFGQVPSEGPSRAHLNPSDRLKRTGRYHQSGVLSGFASILCNNEKELAP